MNFWAYVEKYGRGGGMKIDQRPTRWGWSPGGYGQRCLTCGDGFIGDKRASSCADCAYKRPDLEETKESVSADLKTCPFCKTKKPTFTNHSMQFNGEMLVSLGCCGFRKCGEKAELIEDWNKRGAVVVVAAIKTK